MKPIFLVAALIMSWILPCPLRAQSVDTTVCDILANPQSFDGKIVRVKGAVVAGLEEFTIKGSGCNQTLNSIWLDYPAGTKGKAGPAAFLQLQLAKNNPSEVASIKRTSVTLDKNDDFKKFDAFLSTPIKTNGTCLGCVRFTVTATLVGRLDGTRDTGLVRDANGKAIGVAGFGNMNRYSARLVLQSVVDVTSQEIDYAKGGPAAPPDAVSANASFTPGPFTPDMFKRGVDAFGAQGDDNGVIVGFGVANEIRKDDGAKSNSNSPDGLTLDVTFDSDRLKGPDMQIVLAHVGTHIADLRSSQTEIANLIPYGLEFRALQTTLLGAVAVKAKTMELPGGYVIYSQSWSSSDLDKNALDGLTGFLANWVNVTNPPKH